MSRLPNPRRRDPTVDFDGAAFRVESRGKTLSLAASRESEDELVIALDDVAAYDDGDEIAIEDLPRLLEAIEEKAEELGLSVAFD